MMIYIVDLSHIGTPLQISLASSNAGFSNVNFSNIYWFGDDQHVLVTKYVRAGTDAQNGITLLLIDTTTQSQQVLRTYTQKAVPEISGVTVAPNGHFIAMEVFNGISLNIVLLGVDGHDLKTIPDPTGDTRFLWSPDGQYLALVSGEREQKMVINVLQLSDLSVHQVFNGLTNLYDLLWSPDSRMLLVCQLIHRNDDHTVIGQTLLVPAAGGTTPTTLFNKYVCPELWGL